MVSINNSPVVETRRAEAACSLLSHTRNDIQNWLLSTQWRRVPPGESDIPIIYPDARMEKDGYMALNAQGGAYV